MEAPKMNVTNVITKLQDKIHEGIKYECDQCDYQAAQQTNLKTHTMSVHEGSKYQCDLCEFKATQKG